MRAMMRSAAVIFTIMGFALAAGAGADAASAFKQIYKVDSAAASLHGNTLTVIASGAAATGGWTKPRLRLKSRHPENGEVDFEFLAEPPSPDETVIQALVPLTAAATMKHFPTGVTQIHVEAESNSTVSVISR
jgi:hypothetical protein